MVLSLWPWVLLGVALGYAGIRVLAGYPPRPAGLHTLRRSEAAFVAAAAEALFPAGGPVAPSGLEAGIPAYVDRYLAQLPGRTRLLMGALFFLVEHATLFFPARGGFGFRRFSSLDSRQRGPVLEGWASSRWFPRRLAFTSLRAILTMGYFADPVVLRRLGLAPYAIDTPVCEADLLYPPIGQPLSAIRHRPGDVGVPVAASPLALDAPLHSGYRAEPGP